MNTILFPHAAIDCAWGEWAPNGDCSTSCDIGVQQFSRRKLNFEADGGKCEGKPTKVEECKIKECPINCIWGEWASVGSCSRTCGEGTRTYSRKKLIVDAHGGKCQGNPTKVEQCKDKHCPINCVWGEWTSVGSCSKECGDGTQTRTRTCTNPAPANGGADCVGEASENQACILG